MDIDNIRKKELIQYYQTKRLFLFLDEWGFYLLLVNMRYFGFSMFLILPILLYGSIGLYTSYKNLDKIENKIIPLQQEIYAYQDLYTLVKWMTEKWKSYGFRINVSAPAPVLVPESTVLSPAVSSAVSTSVHLENNRSTEPSGLVKPFSVDTVPLSNDSITTT